MRDDSQSNVASNRCNKQTGEGHSVWHSSELKLSFGMGAHEHVNLLAISALFVARNPFWEISRFYEKYLGSSR